MIGSDRGRNQREISAKRQAIVSEYSARWSGMIRAWRAPRTNDAVWLTYSANYLFNTRGLKWAVDPVLLRNRIPEAPVLNVSSDLAGLEFVLLSHAHADHKDVALWSQMEGSHCHWIVPDHMAASFAREVSVNDSAYSVAVPGRVIVVSGLRILPFEAPHYEHVGAGETTHVDSTGYLVETAGASYLFPGDIRTYDPLCLEPFADVSTVFAHLFLGRSSALVCDPPLLEDFVKFYLSVQPQQVVLSHLYELGRDPEDCWLASHARAAAEAFRAADSEVEVLIPEWYEETIL
jgi:hypothetical protein